MSDDVAFSATDLAILRALQADAAQPARQLADTLGMSQSTLWRRVKELEEAGAITKRVALLDADVLGVPVCVFVHVNLAEHDANVRCAFEAFVRETPAIMTCFSVTGAHDYTLIVRTRSVADFERVLMEEILAHPSVATAMSQLALRQHKYSTEIPL